MSPPQKRLTPRNLLVALLDATGRTTDQIAAKTGYTREVIYNIRSSPLYKVEVAEIRKRIEDEAISGVVELPRKFDEEAPEAFNTIKHLHKKAESEPVRLNAAKDILDRAPNAPKIRQYIEGGGGNVTLQIGVKQMEAINEALDDVDAGDIIELLEGDYETIESTQSKMIEVKEI